MLSLLLSRSFHDPSKPLSSLSMGDSLYNTLTGGRTSSTGLSVNRQMAMTYAAFLRGVSIISGVAAATPVDVLRRVEGSTEPDRQHPVSRLLRISPYRDNLISSFSSMQTIFAHAVWTGNGYWYILRNNSGRPLELWTLNPDTTFPVRENGRLWYVTAINGTYQKLAPRDVFHLRGLSDDGITGMDVISYAAETLGLGIAVKRYAALFFKNDATPGLALEFPSAQFNPETAKKIRDSWQILYGGLENKHRVGVLMGGQAKTLTTDPSKTQMAQLRVLEVRDVANVLGLPPHLLGDPTRQGYNSLEMEDLSFLRYSENTWLVRFESEAKLKLLSSSEIDNDTHIIEFNRDALVRVDFATKIRGLIDQTNNTLLLPNEARRLMNRPSLGPEGNRPRMPTSVRLVAADDEEPPPPEPDDPAPPDGDAGEDARDAAPAAGAAERVLCETTQRLARNLINRGRRNLRTPERFAAWLNSYPEQRVADLAASLQPAAALAGRDEVDLAAALVQQFVQTMTGADENDFDDRAAALMERLPESCAA